MSYKDYMTPAQVAALPKEVYEVWKDGYNQGLDVNTDYASEIGYSKTFASIAVGVALGFFLGFSVF